jgi:S-adenosylmethionine:tRNA ribosyltransferase-isomerase
MDIQDFRYDLPPGAIARYPAEKREDARLMILPRAGGALRHSAIRELPDVLGPGDLLIVNDTRVVPWRLIGQRPTGGKVEVLLIRREAEGLYRAMVSANHPLPEGERVRFKGGREAELGPPGAERLIRFLEAEGVSGWIEKSGELPIPPYLERRAEPVDTERYQTVFAAKPGAIAAPTAGLHFTDELIKKIESRGAGFASLTLHVGPGTFRPVKTNLIENHEMDSETYFFPAETAGRIEGTRRAGGRIVAVGTTVVRVLETAARESEENGWEEVVRASAGETRLFIRPGHEFRAVDALLTNFHLPGSTLLILVAAFAGRERILEAYEAAREAGYRFYSYGDAMLIR